MDFILKLSIWSQLVPVMLFRQAHSENEFIINLTKIQCLHPHFRFHRYPSICPLNAYMLLVFFTSIDSDSLDYNINWVFPVRSDEADQVVRTNVHIESH